MFRRLKDWWDRRRSLSLVVVQQDELISAQQASLMALNAAYVSHRLETLSIMSGLALQYGTVTIPVAVIEAAMQGDLSLNVSFSEDRQNVVIQLLPPEPGSEAQGGESVEDAY